MKRKSFKSEFKAKVAIAALKGQETTNEIAQEFGVHPTQVNTWKKQLLESSSDVFGAMGVAIPQSGPLSVPKPPHGDSHAPAAICREVATLGLRRAVPVPVGEGAVASGK